MLRRFGRSGFLAVHPPALLALHAEPPKREVKTVGGCSVIEIFGPLVHHDGDWCDSYDAIAERVAQACKASPATIVLKVDSPGGDVSGCMDTAREIRARCKAAGKQLVTYIDGSASSAAYALACAAEKVFIPPTGIAGSIGVLHMRVDSTAQDAALGMRFALVASGERKGDGNPHTPLTDAELESTQGIVDSLAQVFFALVSELRGIPLEKVIGFQARQYAGREAVANGLADRVASFDELLASLAGGGAIKMGTPYEDARAALAKAAEGDGEEAKKAKAALAAMDGEPEDDEKKAEGDEPAEEEKKAEGDEPADKDKPKPEEGKAKAAAGSTVVQLATQVSSLSAKVTKLEAEKETADRSAFLASRPDLGKELVTVLQTKPLAEVKSIVNAIPKPPGAPKPTASSTVTPTRGAGQTDVAAPGMSATAEEREMDARMGITSYGFGARKQEYSGRGVVHMEFGALPDAEKKAPVAGKEGAK